MNQDSICLLYDLFANLLAYPTPKLLHQAGACAEKLRHICPEATAALEKFSAALADRTLAQNEELYTITFDMQPVCYPYVGYHLFGESYKRGAFMAQLNEAYHAFGYSAGDELPDHVPAILRFLSLDATNRHTVPVPFREGEFCQALLAEGLVPAIGKMRQAFGEESQNPYAHLLTALLLFLAQTLDAKSQRRQVMEIA
jgi:nitrate reductase delta subunit